MIRHLRSIILLAAGCAAGAAWAENAAKPANEPVLEAPTLHSLGVYWIIKDDANQNAQVAMQYRQSGAPQWRTALPLWRVQREGINGDLMADWDRKSGRKNNKSRIDLGGNETLYAGSALLLTPNTDYELKLALSDPDGGGTERILRARTKAEPIAPPALREFHVVPGYGGGKGSAQDPYRGLKEAQANAAPGDLFLLHDGVYLERFVVDRSGEPGRPIIWRGAGDGEAIVDPHNPLNKLQGAGIRADKVHDVWFEKLTVRNVHNAVSAHESSRIVVRRCHLYNCINGVFAVGDGKGRLADFFISDNLFEGIMPWPTTHEEWGKLPESRAVWVSGSGHDVCYNRIRHFKDGVDAQPGPRCVAMDFHHNDISEMFDDGIEMDGSERNTRCFFNRLTNVFQGISVQPVFGGPVYVFRNTMYNCQVEPFKLHNAPSGALFMHNTVVKEGIPLILSTSQSPYHCFSRNNLFIGTSGRAYHCDPQMIDCDFDYDGFGGQNADVFIKWNRVFYHTPEEIRANGPVYKNVVVVDPATVFASGVKAPVSNQTIFDGTAIDLRLKDGSAAIDAGEVLPGINDGFAGKAPDLGAFELGAEPPHYGPRPEK